MSNKDKIKPKGRPKASSFRKLSKSVTVKFSKPDYDRLCLRSRQTNRTLAEYIRDTAFNTQIVAKHSTEEITTMRNLVGMANNLNQLAHLGHIHGGLAVADENKRLAQSISEIIIKINEQL